MPLQDDPAERTSLYECIDCRQRVEDPDSRLCECGGYLQNIGIPRSQ